MQWEAPQLFRLLLALAVCEFPMYEKDHSLGLAAVSTTQTERQDIAHRDT